MNESYEKRYPDRPKQASNGKEFEALVVELHRNLMDWDIGFYQDRHRQINVGESQAGVEIKYLRKANDYIHIEVEERTALDRSWVPSGIYREDNAVLYCCGNERRIWVFEKRSLQKWHQEQNPEEYLYPETPGLATIKSAILPAADAKNLAIYGFENHGGLWGAQIKNWPKLQLYRWQSLSVLDQQKFLLTVAQ